MKLVIKQKLSEQTTSKKEELKAAVYKLNDKLSDFKIAMQEKVPLDVAKEYFSMFPAGQSISISKDLNKADELEKYAEDGKVRIGDIFIIADELNNIHPDVIKYFNKD